MNLRESYFTAADWGSGREIKRTIGLDWCSAEEGIAQESLYNLGERETFANESQDSVCHVSVTCR